MRKLRVCVIGCGEIAQVMHLPHIRDLPDRFQLQVLCDVNVRVLKDVAEDYAVGSCSLHYEEVVSRPDVDAVFVLSGGDHAPPVLSALEAGKHVFVEKPLCFSLRDADAIRETALRKSLCVMVGYMKWFDPAFDHARFLLRREAGAALLQVTSVLPPDDLYLRHHRVYRSPLDPPTAERLASARDAALANALPDVPASARDTYADVLLNLAIHDLYVARGLVGDPQQLESASVWAEGRGLRASWSIDSELLFDYTLAAPLSRPGPYKETVTYCGPQQRLVLDFQSPYLRNAPTRLVCQDAVEGNLVECAWTLGFEEAFKSELVHFHECVMMGVTPRASPLEGRKDIKLLQAALRRAVQ